MRTKKPSPILLSLYADAAYRHGLLQVSLNEPKALHIKSCYSSAKISRPRCQCVSSRCKQKASPVLEGSLEKVMSGLLHEEVDDRTAFVQRNRILPRSFPVCRAAVVQTKQGRNTVANLNSIETGRTGIRDRNLIVIIEWTIEIQSRSIRTTCLRRDILLSRKKHGRLVSAKIKELHVSRFQA